jgi:hypothetical protein
MVTEGMGKDIAGSAGNKLVFDFRENLFSYNSKARFHQEARQPSSNPWVLCSICNGPHDAPPQVPIVTVVEPGILI